MLVFALLLQFNSIAPLNTAQAASDAVESQEAELDNLSSRDPFPAGGVSFQDPMSQKAVDRVLIGPAFKAQKGAQFNYYRYVTFYNIEKRKERITTLPVQREQCFDKSEVFASYTYSYAFAAAVNASVSLEGLGLSTTLTKTQTLTMGRNIRATGKIVADHTPYLIKQDWYGRTFIQTYNTNTRKAEFVERTILEHCASED